MRVPSSSGVTVAVHDLGGDGPALIVAHATGFCGQAYGPMAAALQSRFHVWALDFRGHGDSTPPADGDYGWDGMAGDLLAAADAIGMAPYAGFGHSMGGAAVLLAERARPGLFTAAYLYEPIVLPPGDRPPGESGLSAGARRRRPVFDSKADVLWRYASRPPLHVLRADALAAYVDHGFADNADGTVRLKCEPEAEAATFDAGAGSTLDRVAGMTLPVTVAIGLQGGGEGPALWGPPLAAALPAATLVEYEHLGHFGPLQDPDTVAVDVATRCGSSGR